MHATCITIKNTAFKCGTIKMLSELTPKWPNSRYVIYLKGKKKRKLQWYKHCLDTKQCEVIKNDCMSKTINTINKLAQQRRGSVAVLQTNVHCVYTKPNQLFTSDENLQKLIQSFIHSNNTDAFSKKKSCEKSSTAQILNHKNMTLLLLRILHQKHAVCLLWF